MSNLLFASISLAAALMFGPSLTEAPQLEPSVEAQASDGEFATGIGTPFSVSGQCTSITIENFTGTTHHFLIGADCNGDGVHDGVMDETFVPLQLDKREPSSEQVRRKWWYPCRFTHLIYAGPSGGVGSPGTVTQVGPCNFEIR